MLKAKTDTGEKRVIQIDGCASDTCTFYRVIHHTPTAFPLLSGPIQCSPLSLSSPLLFCLYVSLSVSLSVCQSFYKICTPPLSLSLSLSLSLLSLSLSLPLSLFLSLPLSLS